MPVVAEVATDPPLTVPAPVVSESGMVTVSVPSAKAALLSSNSTVGAGDMDAFAVTFEGCCTKAIE